MLRVDGTDFDPHAFLAESSLEPFQVYRRGEPMASAGPRANLRHASSGFKCDVSDADSLRTQIEDAITFLTAHRSDLVRLSTDRTVEEPQLDFGYQCRLGEHVVMQGEYLPPGLLRLAGEFGLGIALSLYPPVDES